MYIQPLLRPLAGARPGYGLLCTEGFGEGVAPSFCLRRLFYIDANETHLSGAAAEQPCVSPPPATFVMGPM